VLAQLSAWAPDLIVVAAFGQILPKAVLDLPPKGCLNVHASLLPRWRGASPIQAAIAAGDDHSGVTIMLMDEVWIPDQFFPSALCHSLSGSQAASFQSN